MVKLLCVKGWVTYYREQRYVRKFPNLLVTDITEMDSVRNANRFSILNSQSEKAETNGQGKEARRQVQDYANVLGNGTVATF